MCGLAVITSNEWSDGIGNHRIGRGTTVTGFGLAVTGCSCASESAACHSHTALPPLKHGLGLVAAVMVAASISDLAASWRAGVVRYDVDFAARTVSYFGAHGKEYVEATRPLRWAE
jgi:hypothetical protein